MRRPFQEAGKSTDDVPKFDEFEKASFAEPQPCRTDLEGMLGDKGFIDALIGG